PGESEVEMSEVEGIVSSSKYVNEPAQGYVEYSNIGWIWNDIPKALELARKEDKLVLLDFWASWCGWCIKADKETFPDSRVEGIIKKYYIAVKIDHDRYKELAVEYGIRGLPTVVILDKEGNVKGRIVGFRKAEEFANLLAGFLGK
ncbi:MAG: thioredoxin family protein, partial [Candidatus Methanofastidiosia archaeon]